MTSPLWTDLLARLRSNQPDRLVEWLHKIPFLEGVHPRHLRQIARLLHRRTFEPGEVVFRQGETGSGMYIIQTGLVRIVSEDMVRGEVQLAVLEPGQVFGEMALLDHASRSASAVCQTESVLYGFFEGDLDQLERTRPQAAARLLRNLGLSLAVRLRHTNERLHEVEEGSARANY
ncbi:MAG TPA: cyclic nucleotide-binding domain-containing protein [Fibrobacteria bacterium]|nr:cyclic nucleotide-binding domain-containing protein [Fibrobacteria bacterium]